MNERDRFRSDLISLINSHSLENRTDTPDFILADFLMGCLESYESAIENCYDWHNK